jgi:hypothetical protein
MMRKTNAELEKENSEYAFLEKGRTLFADKKVELIVYGVIKIVAVAFLMALVGLVIYAKK